MKLIETLFSIINTMSIYLLFGFLIAGVLHVFVPQKIFVKYLSNNNFMSVFYSALFGIPLPLCSCGVIPTAMSLYKDGASKGAVVSFLIATPQTGIDSIIATYSLLGLPFAILRPIAAFVTALAAGNIANLFVKENSIKKEIVHSCLVKTKLKFSDKIKSVFKYSFVEMMHDIGKTLLIGLIIAGFISYFVPDNFFEIFKDNTLLSMILILFIAIPMYVCATGSIPIAVALMLKGMSPGTAFVLLIAGPAANFASILVIGKVLGKKTLVIYLLIISFGAILFGLFIDYVLPVQWFDISYFISNTHHHSLVHNILKITSTIFLLSCIIYVLLFHKEKHLENNFNVYKIDGMRCNKCKANIEKVISNIKGVSSVNVDLSKGVAEVSGTVMEQEIEKAVSSIGFKFKGKIETENNIKRTEK